MLRRVAWLAFSRICRNILADVFGSADTKPSVEAGARLRPTYGGDVS